MFNSLSKYAYFGDKAPIKKHMSDCSDDYVNITIYKLSTELVVIGDVLHFCIFSDETPIEGDLVLFKLLSSNSSTYSIIGILDKVNNTYVVENQTIPSNHKPLKIVKLISEVSHLSLSIEEVEVLLAKMYEGIELKIKLKKWFIDMSSNCLISYYDDCDEIVYIKNEKWYFKFKKNNNTFYIRPSIWIRLLSEHYSKDELYNSINNGSLDRIETVLAEVIEEVLNYKDFKLCYDKI